MMQADLFFTGSHVPSVPEEVQFVVSFRPLAHTEFFAISLFLRKPESQRSRENPEPEGKETHLTLCTN